MRSKKAQRRVISNDAIYNDAMVTKTINRLMVDGKKTVAEKQFYLCMDILKEKTGQEPLVAFNSALENIRPQMEVRARRIGGAAYQVPTAVRPERRDSLAIRWLVTAARARSNSEYHSFGAKLAAELIDALNNAGGAVKKKLDIHRMAEANKAFAHFRW